MPKNGTVVGSPITPASLAEMGALDKLPPPERFDPGGNWTAAYRIWTCHGYRESGNDDRGFLRIERTAAEAGLPFTLRVDWQIVHDGANTHVMHAEITCRNDELASPIGWELSSRFFGPDGKHRRELDSTERVRIADGAMEITVQQASFRRNVSHRMTADWCLIEALQRRPFDAGPSEAFDMLEGLSLVRSGHRLSPRGRSTLNTPDGGVELHWLQQLGHGTWPYEYWLDDQHRLLAAVTNSRAYILDDAAAEKIKQREIKSRQSEQQRRQKRGPA